MREAFLAALAKTSREFTCPATGMLVTIRAPSVLERQMSHAKVDGEWSERALNVANLSAYNEGLEFETLVHVAKVGAEHIGREALGLLDENTLEFYLEQLRLCTDDSVVQISGEDVDGFLDELKKKPGKTAESLSTFGYAKLRGLLLSMASRLLS